MERDRRPKRVLSFVLGLAAVLALSFSAVTPALAATNPTLGELTAANPAANKYAGCVAAVLTGGGVTFGSAAALGADLAAIWSTLPAGLSAACRTAVDGNQPQVCVNPADPATCPAVGPAATTAAMAQAVGVTGTWKLVTDGVGIGGYAQTPIPAGLPAWSAIASATASITTPASVCSTSDCTGKPGLWTNCFPTNCGEVTSFRVTVIGRTPNGENAVGAHLKVADAFGHFWETNDFFGSNPGGCASGDCAFTAAPLWTCLNAAGLGATCALQTLTVTLTFLTYPFSPPANLAQLVEFQLSTNNLDWHANPACPAFNDCIRYDDPRMSYLDASGSPTAVQGLGAATPSAVIDLASSSLSCLIGVDVTKSPAVGCVDVTGVSAPLLQTARPPIVVASPPSITATASPAGGGWQRTPVTVSLSASDAGGPGVASITYRSSGAQVTPETVVAASTAQVVVSADGTTTITYRATDAAGLSSDPASITVQVDQTPPTVNGAAPGSGWSATNLTVACTAADATSGLADPSQALISLATTVPAGSETASATTGSATVCDLAGNCSVAGPISGIKIDRLAPSIVITAPSGTYSFLQYVRVAYSCSDAGSGVVTCTGPQPSGWLLNTFLVGDHTFTVTATDAVGNSSQLTSSYTVAAPSCGADEEGDHRGQHQGGWCEFTWR